MEETLNKGSKKKFWLIGIVIAAAVALLIVGLAWRLNWWPFENSTYQAVFLTNNQVYFGKLSEKTDKYAVLEDVYYLRVTQPLQPSQPQPAVNLVKLGNELHGPADKMEINRDQILFIEDLKPDSQVVVAIKNSKVGK